jgi:hypothetical protein
MSFHRRLHLAVRLAIGLTAVALVACGATTPTASNPSPSPAASTTGEAPCTVSVVMVPIKAKYDTGGNRATVAPPNGGLLCASRLAKITVLIGPANPPAGSPAGALHLVLLEDQAGQWVIANATLCDSAGQPVRPLPLSFGQVCGLP